MCVREVGGHTQSAEVSTSGRGAMDGTWGAPTRGKWEWGGAEPALIPGLPDEVALLCLARVPRSLHSLLSKVARGWRGAVEGGLVDLARRAGEVYEEWLLVVLRSEDETQLLAFDPATNRWAQGPKDTPGGDHYWAGNQGTRCLVVDNKVYIVGGGVVPRDARSMLPTYFLSNEVCVFDPLACSWDRAPRMRAVRLGAACCVINNTVWLAGGSDLSSAEKFDPRVGEWETVPRVHVPCPALYAANAFGQRFHIVGGSYRPSAEDPSTPSSSKPAPPVFTPHATAPAQLQKGRKEQQAVWDMVDIPLWFDPTDMGGPVALVGGVLYTVDQRCAELRAYDTQAQAWVLVDRLHASLEKTCMKLASLNGELFVVAKGEAAPAQEEFATHWIPTQYPGVGTACSLLGCSATQKPAWHVMAVGGTSAPSSAEDKFKLIGAVSVRV